jgi:electron transport complex protein RnfE
MSAPAPERALPRDTPIPQLMFLGLCPLLAKGTTLLSAVCLAVTAAVILCASACCLWYCRRLVPAAAPMVFLVLLTATWAAIVDLGLQYWSYPLREGFGIYVPLIAANCLILSTLAERLLHEGTAGALGRACLVGGWVILCVAVVGGVRELATTGQLLADSGLSGFALQAAPHGTGLALLRTSAGVFLILGLLGALLQWFLRRRVPA